MPAASTHQQAIGASVTHHRACMALATPDRLSGSDAACTGKAAAELTARDLLEAAQRSPHFTICLPSALARHDLTETIAPRHVAPAEISVDMRGSSFLVCGRR